MYSANDIAGRLYHRVASITLAEAPQTQPTPVDVIETSVSKLIEVLSILKHENAESEIGA